MFNSIGRYHILQCFSGPASPTHFAPYSAHDTRRRRCLPAVFTVEEEGELTAPWIILRLEKATSATVPAKRWDSTSFRLEEHQRLRFKELCHENGETTCQVIRAFIDYYIESHQRS